MNRPTFLVTNDDGIQTFFIHALVKALAELGTVYMAAPASEQSWIGKAVSRHREVKVQPYERLADIMAWEVDGTPSDAVNIALGHLLPGLPDVVVSGINIGWNAMVPILYSSGTVAGALEGAAWGIPAVALSMHLLTKDFDNVKKDSSRLPMTLRKNVELAALLGAGFAASKVGEGNPCHTVHNVNFPAQLEPDTPWIQTQPGRITLGNLFERTSSGAFSFRHVERMPVKSQSGLPEDFETFAKGGISLSTLKFGNLGRDA